MTHPAVHELKKIEGERFFRKFDDWLGLMLAAFERDDPTYLKILERYGPRQEGKPHPADHFAHALGAILQEMHKDNEAGVIRDHLGEIYETEGAAERETAQFFTPMALCEFMAQMIVDESAREDARIADPSCGSGRLFLACIRLRPKGFFFGVDKDATCAKMTALNLLWRNVDACILWGDCLRVKASGGWMTSRTALGGQVAAFDAVQAQRYLEDSISALRAAPQPSPATQQPPQVKSAQEPPKEDKRGQFKLEL
jgi:hypothetical protein